jgi:protein phosphatase
MIIFGMSDKGLQRANNEDCFMVADLTRKVIGVKDNLVTKELIRHEVGERGTLLAVADGLGGYNGGEVASRIAVEATVQALLCADDGVTILSERLAKAVEEAHHAIRWQQQDENLRTRMASTLTALYIGHGTMTIAQVGDSRAYRFCNGKLTLLTEDQTVVSLMRKRGVLSDEDASRHPLRHALLQALGQGRAILPELRSLPFRDGDSMLLCTDGLSSYVDHRQIELILASDDDEEVRCYRLIEAANAAGGPDNVTVLLARLIRAQDHVFFPLGNGMQEETE